MKISKILKFILLFIFLNSICVYATQSNNKNIQPVAVTGNYAPIVTGFSIYLDASDSIDANHDTLTYSWNLVSTPDNSKATISNSENVKAIFNSDVKGTYLVSLIVNDGKLDSHPANISIQVISVKEAALYLLDYAIYEIKSIDKSSLISVTKKNELIYKTGVVVEMISKEDFINARNELSNDILKKIDGCFINHSAKADKTDWIVSCDDQYTIYALLNQALQYLEKGIH